MIVHYTEFKNNQFGNGAYKRSYQITSLLSTLKEEVITVSKYPVQKNDVSLFERLQIAWAYYKFFEVKEFNLKKVRYKVLDIVLWKKWLTNLKEVNDKLTVVYELSYYSDYSLLFACQQLDIKIIGLPHNLESLVYQQKSRLNGAIAPQWFPQEIKLLSLFSKVYTISREEQWLLCLYDIDADYLPYIPSKAVTTNCLKVKKLRKLENKRFYLTIGTASNPPTVEGFKELFSFFEASNIQDELLVAGYETEGLKSHIKDLNNNIKLLGSLNEEQLEDALAKCKAVIIHQKPTSGALTKIPELLLSGIPVICNAAAARNYFNMEGVYIYKTVEDLQALLEKTLLSGDFNFASLDRAKCFLNEL